jgi:folate-binding protein YgfZ
MIPADSAASYDAARHRAAFIDRSARGRLIVSGRDRATYLQGLLTNDIAALPSGRGCYAAYLTAQGRMITDVYVYELGDLMLLTLDRGVKDAVLAKLDQFIFGEDVQLGDATDTFSEIAVIGPQSGPVLAAIVGSDAFGSLPEHGNLRADWSGTSVIVTRVTDTGEPGYDVFLDTAQRARFTEALRAAGVPALDDRIADAIRIEAGVPVFHRDMDEDTIPLEAGIESRAISFTKGCYVGQEVIIRVLHRGHGRVARKLVGIAFDGTRTPAPGSVIRSGDREIGQVTSSALSPALQRPIALGYVHRDFIEPGTPVASDELAGAVTALPFVAVKPSPTAL